MRIIEFAGLTGSGKSTLCRSMITSMDKPQKLILYSDVFSKLSIKRLAIPFFRVGSKFRAFEADLLSFARDYENVSTNALDKLKVLYLAGCIASDNSIMLLDEGFIQTITSIAHLDAINETEAIKKLTQDINSKFDLTVVDCVIDKQTALTRLRKRNTGDRFNAIKDDEVLLNALTIKQKNIDTVKAFFPKVIRADLSKPITDLCVQLQRELFGV